MGRGSQVAKDFTHEVCIKPGTQPGEVSQSQDAFPYLLSLPVSDTQLPQTDVQAPPVPQPPAPFLHRENEGDEEESLVTGASALGFHLGLKTL